MIGMPSVQRTPEPFMPQYLWIGCSEIGIPINQIIGVTEKELCIHQNLANMFSPSDVGCLSILQYSVERLGVRDIIVCGHYGCRAVAAALEDSQSALFGNWLRPVHELIQAHKALIADTVLPSKRLDRICELNVIEQSRRLCQTTIVSNAWARAQKLSVHGWIYDPRDGLLHNLFHTDGFSCAHPSL